ncbi:MAG: homoserine kinase [Chloroflexi bacterium]|nr:homoserine kinase [Chloroflexota bacterium]
MATKETSHESEIINHKLRIRVPATTANLGPGFDCLGLALNWWNTIHVETIARGLRVEVDCPPGVDIPRNRHNLVVYGIDLVYRRAGCKRPPLYIHTTTHIPIGSGLGSSSAAIVGGILAANAMLGNPYSRREMVTLATRIEGHPDNVAPALLGGLMVAAIDGKEVTIARFPVPRELRCVLFVPNVSLLTAKSRGVLPKRIPRADAIYNAGRVALWIAALRERRWDWLDVATQDRLHQPYRAKLVPGMYTLFEAARRAGARGVALSGAGPSVIAFTDTHAEDIGRAMERAAARIGLTGQSRVVSASARGAQVTHIG